MDASRIATVLCLMLPATALGGCLGGERPRISTLYPDPTSQAPAVSGQTPLVTGSATRVESYQFYGVPGTTFEYREIPTQPAYPYTYGYGGYAYQRGRVYDPRLQPGQQRYTYLGDQVRCDNVDRSCGRWSGRRAMYVPDVKATRQVYGGSTVGPLTRY